HLCGRNALSAAVQSVTHDIRGDRYFPSMSTSAIRLAGDHLVAFDRLHGSSGTVVPGDMVLAIDRDRQMGIIEDQDSAQQLANPSFLSLDAFCELEPEPDVQLLEWCGEVGAR